MSPYKVVVATDLTEESLSLLQNNPQIKLLTVAPEIIPIREAISDAHALIAREDVLVDMDLLEKAPHLRVIGHVGAGLNSLDIDAATERGIIVTNTPGTNAIAAGELTMAFILALSRRLIVTHDSLKEGWWLKDRKRQAGTQLQGKTIGLIGLGRVGRIVAQRCAAFGMTILAYDPYLSEEQVSDERITLTNLPELLQRSDIVSLHVPITQETNALFNAARIQQMKFGARLINTAHGNIWDEEAVLQALKSGHLSGVALDVYRKETPYHSPLIGQDNVIHTPHIGDNTVEATQDVSAQIVRQVLDALRGVDYRNAVNMPFMPGTGFEAARPYMRLAECMGFIFNTLARFPIRRIAVEYRGEEVDALIKPVTVALLKGILSPALGEGVNYINAPVLAAERGLQLMQIKGLKTADYTNLVSCQVTLEDGEEIIMAGTLLDRKQPHIIQVNEYRMNFVPEGTLLLMGSYDRPGVIGRIGTLMANNDVNIASWQTGRAEPGGQTLTVLTLDHPIPEATLEEIREQDFVRHVHQVQI